MSKLWEDLKKNMKEWGNVAVEKAEEVSKMAVAKTEELTRISKIKIEIHQIQKDLDSYYESLGHWIEEKYTSNKKLALFKDDRFQEIMKSIADKRAVVDKKETEIEKIREEAGTEDVAPAKDPVQEDQPADDTK
ncbi:MAG: hypothetical protein GXO90_09900 [FCB group bacterium]|nr:hypothetical protein [FCB group bacterium]